MYQIEDNILTTQQGALVFAMPIWRVIEIRGILVVLLKVEGRADDVNNVYGVKDGAIIWRVQPLTEFDPRLLHSGGPLWEPFTMIKVYKDEPEFIYGVTFGGFAYLINPVDGKIVRFVCWMK